MASKEEPVEPTPTVNEPAPDPDEDDLDDLDDVLDDFSAAKISSPSTPANTTSSAPTSNTDPSGPGRPQPPTNPPSAAPDTTPKAGAPQPPSESEPEPEPTTQAEAEFTAQLQTGMADMMRELDSNPEMAKQFKQMMASIGAPGGLDDDLASAAGASGPVPPLAPASQTTGSGDRADSAPEATASAGPGPGPGPDFQDTIKRTMERMRTSNASATAASDPSNPTSSASTAEADMMSALLASLAPGGANGVPGGDPSSDPDAMSAMLLNLMESLTNKEILYEPMKELAVKFGPWLAERAPGAPKANTITDEERARYQEQWGLVREIVGRFERDGYSDGNAGDREYVVERMQKMQALGAPPGELVGDMPGGIPGMGEDGLGDADTGCPQQ